MKHAKRFAASLTLACAFGILATAQEPTQDNSSQKSEKVYTSTEVSRKVHLNAKPEAEYTQEARENKIEGRVILRVVLRSNREIGDIAVLNGLQDGLNEKAIEAARSIKFEPALKDGRPVSQALKVEYVFTL